LVVVDEASTWVARRGTRPEDQVTLTIAYHPDVTRVGERARVANELEVARTTPFSPPGSTAVRPLGDRYLSRSPLVRVMTAGARVALEGPPGTPVQVDGQPLAGSRPIFDRAALARGLVIELADRVVLLLHLAAPDGARAPRCELVGDSDALERVRDEIVRAAGLAMPVLLCGEAGSGKQSIARALHAGGSRKDRAFVAVDLAAVRRDTVAAELFGTSDGQPGAVVRADGGTLFLAHVDHAPHDVQRSLVRALESSAVTPPGGAPRTVDVRLVATTVAAATPSLDDWGIREALCHQLAGYQLLVPPLRERRDDIGRLLIYALSLELATLGDAQRLAQQADGELWLSASVVARLVRHPWPGNVRQLCDVARQLAIAGRGATHTRVDPAIEMLLAPAELGQTLT
jgi:two-component system, NtrC family, nitrogen regulation response regulator GlnG